MNHLELTQVEVPQTVRHGRFRKPSAYSDAGSSHRAHASGINAAAGSGRVFSAPEQCPVVVAEREQTQLAKLVRSALILTSLQNKVQQQVSRDLANPRGGAKAAVLRHAEQNG